MSREEFKAYLKMVGKTFACFSAIYAGIGYWSFQQAIHAFKLIS